MAEPVKTWHHGLVAKWWGAFTESGADADYFRAFVERYGEPGLDAGCGSGRILLPCLAAGMDVDGLDAAGDMLAECQRLAEAQGLTPTLHHQPLHLMDLPRRYRSIFICGSFGLGAGRSEDLEAIRRCFAHLEPGGRLAIDMHLPTANSSGWKNWVDQRELPRPWRDSGDRRALADGTELELRSRQIAFDPLEQTWEAEIRITHYNGDTVLGDEIYPLTATAYFQGELTTMLRACGFVDITVTAGLEQRPPVAYEDHYVVVTATRPRDEAD